MITYWSQQSSQREEIATKALCLIVLLPVDSISQSGCSVSHTHEYICLGSAVARSQWSSKPPACHLLFPMNCAVQISKAPKGVAKDFSIAFQGNWAASLVKSTEKNVHLQTWKPQLTEAQDQCLAVRLPRPWQSVWECSYSVPGSKAESLLWSLASHHSSSLDPNQSKHVCSGGRHPFQPFSNQYVILI